MAMPPFPPTVPILGQPLRVIIAFSTAIIECQCEAKSVIMLSGKGRISQCQACGKQFAIADSGALQIGEVRTADKPSLVTQ